MRGSVALVAHRVNRTIPRRLQLGAGCWPVYVIYWLVVPE